MKHGLLPLNPDYPREVRAAAGLHAVLLPESPVARMGRRFMEQYYYRDLVKEGLVLCDLWYHQGKAAGLIAYTRRSSDFMTQGLRRHWPRLLILLLKSCLFAPRRWKVLAATLQTAWLRRRSRRETSQAEILSIGVLPEYRRCLSPNGARIHQELWRNATAHFRRQGEENFHMWIRPDNDRSLKVFKRSARQVKVVPAGAVQLLFKAR